MVYKCKICDCEVIINGCGPVDEDGSESLFTKTLKKLPSSRVFRPACLQHDIDYHIGGKSDEDRKKADEKFLSGMKNIVKTKVNFWKRWIYYSLAYRNYWAVRIGGKSSFNFGGCKK